MDADICAQMMVASSLDMVPAYTIHGKNVVATPVSLQGGTFLAFSSDPKARALAAVIATTNAIPLPLARGRIPVMLPANRELT